MENTKYQLQLGSVTPIAKGYPCSQGINFLGQMEFSRETSYCTGSWGCVLDKGLICWQRKVSAVTFPRCMPPGLMLLLFGQGSHQPDDNNPYKLVPFIIWSRTWQGSLNHQNSEIESLLAFPCLLGNCIQKAIDWNLEWKKIVLVNRLLRMIYYYYNFNDLWHLQNGLYVSDTDSSSCDYRLCLLPIFLLNYGLGICWTLFCGALRF